MTWLPTDDDLQRYLGDDTRNENDHQLRTTSYRPSGYGVRTKFQELWKSGGKDGGMGKPSLRLRRGWTQCVMGGTSSAQGASKYFIAFIETRWK
ncbi:unnamed protein product [Allacma fusca]|uniref:Uncharacterized protein n=1 Tax=Allacma fusca TaxID=39272 RepID=A0A8J2L9R8_9HEXA|nr:unnamed protein product [Allacma fusca]